jgi:membrane fusion protein, copper/silver efflux system
MERGTSQMRRMSLAVVVVAAIAASYGLGRLYPNSHSISKAGRHILYYVDPMHPSYKSDKPGIAPDCGMPLKPVYSDEISATAISSPLAQLPAGAVSIDAATQRMLGIRLAPVEKAGATHSIHSVGRVTPEDTKVYTINSSVEGFIRETFNDSVGTQVKKNQKLATFYSADFLSAASGFLAATERVPGTVGKDGARFTPDWGGTVAKESVRSIKGYTDHLRNLGMSDDQMKRIADSRELPDSIEVLAPVEGFILARYMTPGQHFEHDMPFYRIADLSRVWVVAEVFEQEAPYLRPGNSAEIILRDEGRRLSAHIAASLPQSETGGGTVKIRLEVDNPTFTLRPEMLVDVDLPVHLPAAITVPVDALVDSGENARVYVAHGEGVFEPREVETGWHYGDRVEILRGLQPGEQVVVAATFLVDSESRLKSPDAAMSKQVPAKPHDTRTPMQMPEHMAQDRQMPKKMANNPTGSTSKNQGTSND